MINFWFSISLKIWANFKVSIFKCFNDFSKFCLIFQWIFRLFFDILMNFFHCLQRCKWIFHFSTGGIVREALVSACIMSVAISIASFSTLITSSIIKIVMTSITLVYSFSVCSSFKAIKGLEKKKYRRKFFLTQRHFLLWIPNSIASFSGLFNFFALVFHLFYFCLNSTLFTFFFHHTER